MQFLGAVRNRRGAQLFIERQLERGFAIYAIRESALSLRTTTNNPATKHGADLVYTEVNRQLSAGNPRWWDLPAALGLLVVGGLIVVFILTLAH